MKNNSKKLKHHRILGNLIMEENISKTINKMEQGMDINRMASIKIMGNLTIRTIKRASTRKMDITIMGFKVELNQL